MISASSCLMAENSSLTFGDFAWLLGALKSPRFGGWGFAPSIFAAPSVCLGLDPTVVSPAAISENSPEGRPSGRRRHNCARALLTFRPVEAAQTLKGRGCRGEARDARSLKLTN